MATPPAFEIDKTKVYRTTITTNRGTIVMDLDPKLAPYTVNNFVGLARQGYYDGLTFEVRSEALGPDRPVAVGGRYDGLLARLGGKGDTRAVGCMVRPWRAYAGGEA